MLPTRPVGETRNRQPGFAISQANFDSPRDAVDLQHNNAFVSVAMNPQKSMNIDFRLCRVHTGCVVSIVVLALRLNATKSAVGISLKTQELYLIVFVARYADLFSLCQLV